MGRRFAVAARCTNCCTLGTFSERSMLAERAAKRAKYENEPLRAPIQHTHAREGYLRCGAAAGVNGLSLMPCTFQAQHGSLPSDLKPSDLGNVLTEIVCEIRNARCLKPPPTMATHGYELIPVTLTPMRPEDANDPGPALDLHYRELEAAVVEATGASAGTVFCHARRSTSQTGSAMQPFAHYAHTDQAAKGWPDVLPELVHSGEWEHKGPPGVSRAFAERAAKAKRRAVITAWRYLGPADACRSSHLALLDPATLQADDFQEFDIAAFGNVGRNYRLATREVSRATAGPSGPQPHPLSSQHQRHGWWYFPDMKTSTELLIMIAFDSSHPHAVRAPVAPARPQRVPAQLSLDARAYVPNPTLTRLGTAPGTFPPLLAGTHRQGGALCWHACDRHLPQRVHGPDSSSR